jgi:flagellar motor switch protein FliN
MADNPNDGLLSQDDINAALAAAGLESEMVKPTSPAPAPAAKPETRVDSAGRPFDEVAAAMAEAIAAEQASARTSSSAPAAVASAGPAVESRPFDIPALPSGTLPPAVAHGLDLLRDVDLNVKIELGRSKMLVEDVLRLGEGSVVELDKLAGDPVDVLVNDRLVARGEVLVLNDNFCVRINDIISRDVGQEEVA